MKPVVVVGAGFSGLTLAYWLRRLKVPVRVVEKSDRVGGLLQTTKTPLGLVESAANALINDTLVEELFEELGIAMAKRQREHSRRYIYLSRPRRWPLSTSTTAKLAWSWWWNSSTFFTTREGETLAEWGERTVNREFSQKLLGPVVQGIYGSTAEHLSARLVLASLSLARGQSRDQTRGPRGSVAPKDGMGDLCARLHHYLLAQGVPVELSQEFHLESSHDSPVVFCTNAWTASELLRDRDPQLASQLATCVGLPIISATLFFRPTSRDLKGFGCLFAENQNFESLGALFNDCIFAERSNVRSETWILGGETARALLQAQDDKIIDAILDDRARLRVEPREATARPISVSIHRYPRALPAYTVAWEKSLGLIHEHLARFERAQSPIYLHGNYLGELGLGKILRRSENLAARISQRYIHGIKL